MVNENLNNRQKQALLTKQKIFDTTTKLIEEIPFEKITIRKICKEAEVSVGTFYLYFESKQHILLEMYKEEDKIFMGIDINSKDNLDSFEKIKEFIGIKVSNALNIDIKILREIYSSYMYFDSEYLFSGEIHFLKGLEAIIKDGQKNKEIIESMTSEEISHRIYKFVRGESFDWLVQNGSGDLKKIVEEELSFYLKLFATSKV